MALLEPCRDLWGSATLIESDPAATTYRGALYRPLRPDLFLDKDPAWGVYDASGTLIPEAAYTRLPEGVLIGQSRHIGLNSAEPAPDGDYIYGGPVIMHYGHFLTAALPRLWQAVRDGLPDNARILVHSHQSPDEWFTRDFVRETLGRLGLSPNRFVQFPEATRIKRLHVPRPAMVEQTCVHQVFGELCRHIGLPSSSSARRGPVYLSKTRHQNGTYRVVNEAAIETVMADAKVKVVHPETLSFAEQVGMLDACTTVLGTVGSGFHTSLFCQQPVRIIGLAYGAVLNANYALIDRVTGNDATYVYPPAGIAEQAPETATFCYRLDDPDAVARGLLQLI